MASIEDMTYEDLKATAKRLELDVPGGNSPKKVDLVAAIREHAHLLDADVEQAAQSAPAASTTAEATTAPVSVEEAPTEPQGAAEEAPVAEEPAPHVEAAKRQSALVKPGTGVRSRGPQHDACGSCGHRHALGQFTVCIKCKKALG